MLNITCLTHGLYRLIYKIRTQFPIVDKLIVIALIKSMEIVKKGVII